MSSSRVVTWAMKVIACVVSRSETSDCIAESEGRKGMALQGQVLGMCREGLV